MVDHDPSSPSSFAKSTEDTPFDNTENNSASDDNNNAVNEVENVSIDRELDPRNTEHSTDNSNVHENDNEMAVESVDLDLDALLDRDIPADLDALVDIAATDATAEPLNDPLLENDPLLGLDLPGMDDSTINFNPEPTYQTKEEVERERMKLLVSHFDEQQMSRYAAYRRANIRRASIKKFASQLLNQPISNTVALVLGGMSKVLIGDIIELARDLQDKEEELERQRRNLPDPLPGSEPEPLLPTYIREAWTIYKRETGTVPGPKTRTGSMNRMF